MPGLLFHDLFNLWRARDRRDEYIGTLVNSWLAEGGVAYGVKAGTQYYDVGTMDGYLETMRVLSGTDQKEIALEQSL